MKGKRYQYIRLEEAIQRLWAQHDGSSFTSCMYAVVVEAAPPVKTRGTDWYANIKVVDVLSSDDLGPVELLVFGSNPDYVPFIAPARGHPGAPDLYGDKYEARVGDILRLHHVKLTSFKGRPQLNLKVEFGKAQSWTLFYQEPPEPQLEYAPLHHPFSTVDVHDEDVEELNRIRRALNMIPGPAPPPCLPLTLTGPPRIEPPPHPLQPPLPHVHHHVLQPPLPHVQHQVLQPIPVQNVAVMPQVNTSITGGSAGAPVPPAGAHSGSTMMPPKHPATGQSKHSGRSTQYQQQQQQASHAVPGCSHGTDASGHSTTVAHVMLNSTGSTAAQHVSGPTNTSRPLAGKTTATTATTVAPAATQPAAAGTAGGTSSSVPKFPVAAAGSVLVTLSRLPDTTCLAKPQLVDMFAQVLACDERFLESHGVRLLFLWDGTDIPAIHNTVSTLPALPHKTVLPLPGLPGQCWALPLPPHVSCSLPGHPGNGNHSLQQQGQGAAGQHNACPPPGIHVVEQVPAVGTAIPVLVPADVAVTSLPLPSQPGWIKIKHVSPFVCQGQMQALWLPNTRWTAVDGGKLPQVAKQAGQRLSKPGCTCLSVPPQLYTSALPEAEAAPLVTLRYMQLACPLYPVRVYARLAGHYPDDLEEALIPAAELSELPPEDASHGRVCMIKVQLVDATAELDAVLIGAHALKFFGKRVDWAAAERTAPDIQQVLAQLESSPHAGRNVDAAILLACPQPKRPRVAADAGGSAGAKQPVPVWGEFCLRGLVMDPAKPQETFACRIINTVVT